MKNLFKWVSTVVTMALAVACTTQELDSVNERLSDLESRVSALETLTRQMNSNISSLQGIVTAIQTGDYITSINPIASDGKTIGYTITFAKGQPITLYHGQDGADGHTPVVDVKQDDDGVWYWTIDGQWLLDANGRKVKADGKDGADGHTPVVGVKQDDDGVWYWTIDGQWLLDANGRKVKANGKDGDSMFKRVTMTETEVTFVMADGQTFVVKRVSALSITFDSADLVVVGTNTTRDIHYTITSEVDDITIEALSSADIKVKVQKTDSKTGVIQVKTGDTIDEYSKVVVLVNNGSQAIMRTLAFEEEAIDVQENTTKVVSDAGERITLEFFSNVPCHAVIPEEAQDWISIAPETKGMERQTIDLIVLPNISQSRSVTVFVVGERDDSNIILTYTIKQEMGGVWKDGMVPPDDEIWYVTDYEDLFGNDLESISGVQVISNTYKEGKGIIKLSAPLKTITEGTFLNCYGINVLTHLYLPDCVERIEDNSFGPIRKLQVFYIPKRLKYISGLAFVSSIVDKFEGDERVRSNGEYVVFGDTLVIASTIQQEEFVIPASISVVADHALWNQNPTIKTLRLEEGVKEIGKYSFSGCKELEEVFLPESLEDMPPSPFDLCDKIRVFHGPSKYVSGDGRTVYRYVPLYGGSSVSYLKFISNIAKKDLYEYSVADDVEGIDPESFCRAYSLREITFPKTTLYMSGDTFDECYNLEKIRGAGASADGKKYIGLGVGLYCQYAKPTLLVFAGKGLESYVVGGDECKVIGSSAFAYWPDLINVDIQDGVEELKTEVFWGCPQLKKVSLPHSILRMGNRCFSACPQLSEIYLSSIQPPELADYGSGYDDFLGLKENAGVKIYVPKQSVDLYKKTPYWSEYAERFVGYDFPELDYYISTDYSSDGVPVLLQQSSSGKGINLVFMGDAFSDRQIADGTYGNVMQKAANAFFSEEPYKSMKDRFNVYAVNVVSATEGYEHSGQALSTGHGDETVVFGNDSKVIEYAKKVLPEDKLDDAVIIVIMNEATYAGTCYMYNPTSGDYGRGLSIAYFPISSDVNTFNGLVSHEAGGHGFAKLADEYAYERMGAIPDEVVSSTRENEPYGWWQNVDFTNDPVQVKWSRFLGDSRYADEGLGCYEGGLTYWAGVWRPTDASIMRYNTGGFNAPSRYAIWYRIGKLAYGESWVGNYEDFVAYDAVNRTPAAVQRRNAQRRNCVEKSLPQLPPPVVVGRSWKDFLVRI